MGKMEGRPVCLKVLRIFMSSNQTEKFLKVRLVSVCMKVRPTNVDNSNYVEKLSYGGSYATRIFFLFLVSTLHTSSPATVLYPHG